ncbi:MAG TPA: ABC transporter permease, partial [Xanthomonadales bacterium]|nr:ABC transporter permease [Xanthomonadales bacterium]
MLTLWPSMRQALYRPFSSLLVIALVAVVVLANTTLFSALWTLGGKPLPYRQDARLLELRIHLTDIDFRVSLAPRLLEALRAESSVFPAQIGFPGARTARDADGRTLQLQRISADFNEVLGVQPKIGNAFELARERTASGALPLLISSAHWQQRYGADPAIVGRRERIAEQDFEIVGVMPAVFGFPSPAIDAWTPYQADAAEREQDAAGGFGDFSVVARLADGATTVAAQAALQRVLRADPAMLAMDPDGSRGHADVRSWRERYTGDHWRTLELLQAAALLLLLVVAASLANLGLDHVLA